MGEFLVADIGGSKSRFALAYSEGWPERIAVIKNETVADLETAVERYLEEAGVRPRAATFAIAGPIHGEDIALTNCAWRFRRSDFASRFGFSRLRIVNDFEAIAWALPQLTPAHTRPLGPRSLRRDGVKLVLGPGTGLGVAALLPAGGGGCAIATEGGHISFGAHADDEELPGCARNAARSAPRWCCPARGSCGSRAHFTRRGATVNPRPSSLTRIPVILRRKPSRGCSCACWGALPEIWRLPSRRSAASTSRAA